MKKAKVAVLMSGGVDSSVAAYLLSKNYEVVGITLKLWECNSLKETHKQLCCSPKDIYDAKNVCSFLGINHFVINLSYEFEKYIIESFCEKYSKGFTPNPCIICNEIIKFGFLFNKVRDNLEIDFISSGHYAKVVKQNNRYYIAKAKDANKDQSYFLSRTPKDIMPYLIFPLGDFTKVEVRNIAKDIGIKVADKKESFDLCFVLNGDYRKFLLEKGINVYTKGKLVEYTTGKFLGYHKGYINYTIGQRSGLGLNKKYYVVDLDAVRNILYVDTEKFLYKNTLFAENCIFYENMDKAFNTKLYAKIRYKSELEECIIEKVGDNSIKVIFNRPQKAITKGQYVVIYDEDGKIVISGEIIKSTDS
ncbi:MAG: tRNA 2-thiouridine(34) synthase MnmA [Endomicrobia bacterium]|nr:tRNA 2-thiouridine(34) synthase MnmA [Endomicrobiia bacterium]